LNATLFVDSRGERSCCLETQQGFGLQFNLPARGNCICAETERASACSSDRRAASSSRKRTDDRAGCSTTAPRELATLNIEDIQLREGRWVIIDLPGKGGRIRTVAISIWVKQGINAWMTAAKIRRRSPVPPGVEVGKDSAGRVRRLGHLVGS
jgi:hypothetical protein